MADMPGLKVIMGVGGAFDYWAGEVKRAPQVMRRWGLEWLWRVIHEPKRILRIVRAVIIFPVLAFVDRFRA
jgi:N-acetylglucosaminyldiphosphoundecaprenol N-acetyl-beta-D-mannosaminyltransferase